MEIDPHTIQQILTKVREQLRCPQCRKRVDVTLESLRVVGDDFAVLQLRCDVCDAYIMLYATISAKIAALGAPKVKEIQNTMDESSLRSSRANAPDSAEGATKNFSTQILIDANDLEVLRSALKEANGSFLSLFEENT